MLSTATSYGAESKKSVMVTPLQAPNINSEIKDILITNFIAELNKSQLYNFLSGKIYKDAFEAVMKQQGQECDALKCVRKVADSFGINLILATKIIKNNDIYILDAVIEDLSSGRQIAHASVRCRNCSETDLIDKIEFLAKKLTTPAEDETKVDQRFGYLTVNGSPVGAELFVLGNKIGVIPLKHHKLSSGKNLLSIRAQLYNASSQEITIEEEKETEIEIKLTKTTKKKNVMVTPVQAPAIDKDLKSILISSFIAKLNKSSVYEFLSGKVYKDAFEAAMKEQGQECDAIKCVRRVADSFGVRFVLETKIIKNEGMYIFDAAIEDLSTGNQINHESERCPNCTDTDLIDKIEVLAQKLTDQIESDFIANQRFGYLTINGTPEGAEIFVSENKIGVIPLIHYKISSGKTMLKIKSEFYNTSDQEIVIEDDKESKIEVNLIEKGFTAKLDVKNPNGDKEYDVYLDGIKKDAPDSSIEGILKGAHTIEIRAGKMAGRVEMTGKNGDVINVPIELKTKDYTNWAIDVNYINHTEISLGMQVDIGQKTGYLMAEFSFAMTSHGSDALALRFLTDGLSKDIGGGISYRIALDPPLFDNGFWLGLGVDGINEFLGIFAIPKVELGYSLYIIGGFALNVEGDAGYAIDVLPSTIAKSININANILTYGGVASVSYGW